MIRAVIFFVLLSIISTGWCRIEAVPFVLGTNTVGVPLAVQALRQDMSMNVPVSAISAALIDLDGDGSPGPLVT